MIAGGYYIVTALLLYSSEITTIFNQKKSKQIAPEINEDQNESNEIISDLMGGIRFDHETNVPHENIVESEEINAQPLKEAEESIGQSPNTLPEALLMGTIADLLQGIKTLAVDISNIGKEESTLLFQHLLSRYPQLVQTPYEEAVNLFIYNSLKEQGTDHLELNEIKSWWPQAEINSAISQ